MARRKVCIEAIVFQGGCISIEQMNFLRILTVSSAAVGRRGNEL